MLWHSTGPVYTAGRALVGDLHLAGGGGSRHAGRLLLRLAPVAQLAAGALGAEKGKSRNILKMSLWQDRVEW